MECWTIQAPPWDRGRPARFEHRKARKFPAGSNANVLFALRAHCGRDARGPSEELEWSSTTFRAADALSRTHLGGPYFDRGFATTSGFIALLDYLNVLNPASGRQPSITGKLNTYFTNATSLRLRVKSNNEGCCALVSITTSSKLLALLFPLWPTTTIFVFVPAILRKSCMFPARTSS